MMRFMVSEEWLRANSSSDSSRINKSKYITVAPDIVKCRGNTLVIGYISNTNLEGASGSVCRAIPITDSCGVKIIRQCLPIHGSAGDYDCLISRDPL